uniref:mRNA interferase HigB n=1 Tax=Candidatus Kentrum sp. LFY TaxID=2126342 RepID=A0A450W8P5_9GAMM|nr:MAG: mRNA interferase HigB [Candidatus Kentron sp. LFY]
MRVLGRDKLVKFWRRHVDVKSALQTWFHETEKAVWRTPEDIERRYRSADFLGDNRVIFDIRGNHYRLMVRVRYRNGIVVVEWVGTHAEYDKKNFRDRGRR